ncbi:MAG: transporter [Alphaproteobacteria bacterium]
MIALTVLFSSPALADDAAPPPDKSQYTLFNPVPDDQMRSFATDRPTKSDSPYTVDAGHFQYEADLVNWTYDHTNATHTTTSNILVADPTLKAGLTQNTDLEVALAPLNFNQSRVAGVDNTASGFGDIYTRVKFNLLGNDSGDYALAIVPYVKAPTAAHNVGNNHWEGGGYVPFTAALPADWTLSITSEVDILENAALNGDHANFQNLINFGHPVFTPALTGYVEFWSDVNNDVNTPTQYTADFALAWLAKDNLQLDCGINVGLNKAANDLQPYLGISQRF